MNTFKRGIGQRLQEIRKTLGLTQEEMGAKLDKGKGSVSKYENGDAEPPYDTLEKYAAMSGRDFNWIFTGKQSHEHAMHDEHVGSLIVSETLTEYVSVPRYEVGASAGGGAIVESEQVVDYLMFSKDWVKSALRASPNNLALINVMGDSMSPSYNDGDLILVDTTVNQPKSDAVYVIQHDSCLWVKRLHFHFDGSIAVISDNSRYPEQTITGEALSRLRIVGRVIWRGGKMMGKFWYVLTCLFMMLLAGCGSGGGDEAAQTPDTPTPPLAALSIYDPVTGLRWQKFENSARQDWAGAKAFCDGLLMEGYAWRLPTARELLSAVDFQRSNPATSILPSAYSAYYWAGTEPLYGTSKEWHVDFTSGYVYKEDPATLSYVRCVSGPVLSYHHLDNGNGTVSSPETGLMWQKQTSLTEHNWYEATGTPHVGYNPGSTDVCGTMALAGYDDWRVPNIPELSTIINFGDASDPAIDTDLFPTPWLSDFWSSTVPFAGYAWYSRSDGSITRGSINATRLVRCVRSNKPPISPEQP